MAVSTFKRKEVTGVGYIRSVDGSVPVRSFRRSSDEHYILKSAYMEDGNYRYMLPNQYATIYVGEPDSTHTAIYAVPSTGAYIGRNIHFTLELDEMCDHYS